MDQSCSHLRNLWWVERNGGGAGAKRKDAKLLRSTAKIGVAQASCLPFGWKPKDSDIGQSRIFDLRRAVRRWRDYRSALCAAADAEVRPPRRAEGAAIAHK
jgi:hypothetical protein